VCVTGGGRGRGGLVVSVYGVATISRLKLQVYFAEYSLFYRALLQKRPIILRSLLIVATPYVPISLVVSVSMSVSMSVRVRVCVRVCVFVCVYVCAFVCTRLHLSLCVYVAVYSHTCVRVCGSVVYTLCVYA